MPDLSVEILFSCILTLVSDFNGGSSNGRTVVSDTTNLGSNPSPPAINQTRQMAGFFWRTGMRTSGSTNERSELERRSVTTAARRASAWRE